jgi:hypothetical protein
MDGTYAPYSVEGALCSSLELPTLDQLWTSLKLRAAEIQNSITIQYALTIINVHIHSTLLDQHETLRSSQPASNENMKQCEKRIRC